MMSINVLTQEMLHHKVFSQKSRGREEKSKLTVSPSLVQGRPFCRYFPWLWRFFWPPSANLHNKGSDGTGPVRKYYVIFKMLDSNKMSSCQQMSTDTSPGTPGGVLIYFPLKCWMMASHFSVDSILQEKVSVIIIIITTVFNSSRLQSIMFCVGVHVLATRGLTHHDEYWNTVHLIYFFLSLTGSFLQRAIANQL